MSYKFNPFTGNLDFVGDGSSVSNEEVFSFPDFAAFPPVGESGKLYVDLFTGKNYYWNGSNYLTTKSNSIIDTIVSYEPLSDVVNSDVVKDPLGNLFATIDQDQFNGLNLIEGDSNFDTNILDANNGVLSQFLNYLPVTNWVVNDREVTVDGNFGSFELNQDLSEFIGLPDNYIAADRWSMSVTGTVNFTPDATSFGFGIGLKSVSQVEKYSLLGRVSTANDAFIGRSIVSHNQNGSFNVNVVDSGGNTIPINNGNVIKLDVRLRDNIFTVTASNLSVGGQSTTQFNFTLNTIFPFYLPNMGSPALWVFGGSFEFQEFSYTIEETINPDTIILGDSKVRGYNAGTYGNRWVNVLKSKNPRVIAFSGLADTIDDVQRLVNNSSYFNTPNKRPLNVVVAVGSNDIRFGLPNIELRYADLISSIKAVNPALNVYVSELHNEATLNTFNFNNFLSTTYSDLEILRKVTVFNTDGIHPSSGSHHNIGNDYIKQFPALLKRRYYDTDLIQKALPVNFARYKEVNQNNTKREIYYAYQLPLSSDGSSYILEPRTTYILRGLIHIGDRPIIVNDSNTIVGFDKSDDGIIYTGTGAAIRSTNYTCTISNIFTSQPNGQLIDFVGREIDSIQIRECIIGSGAIGTVNGGNIVAFNNNICSANMTGGFTIQGTGRNIGIANNYFANENAPFILNLPSGTFRTAKIADNDFRVNNIGIQVGDTFSFTAQGGGQVSDNVFSGSSIIANRIVGIDDDTLMWVLENNTGLVSTSDGYSPNTIKVISDEFLNGGTETGEIGDLGWQFSGGSISTTNVNVVNHPGVIRRTCQNSAATLSSLFFSRTANSPNIAYADFVSLLWIISPIDFTVISNLQLGASSDFGSNTPTHGFYFSKLTGETTWFAVSRNNGVQTRVDTLVPITTTFTKFEIVKALDGLHFKINGTEVALINSNLPDNADLILLGNSFSPTTNTSRNIDIDYFSAIIKTNNR